jgi:hypothetical protein
MSTRVVIARFGIQGLLIEMLFIGIMSFLIWQASHDAADQGVVNTESPAAAGDGPRRFVDRLADLMNEAFETTGAGVREGPVRFYRLVLWGTGAGALLVLLILAPLEGIEGFGSGSLLTVMLIGGATVGTLTLAIWRAYRVIIVSHLVLWGMMSGPSLVYLVSHDWMPVHSWGWMWVEVSLGVLAAAVMAAILAHFGVIRRTPAPVTLVAALLGMAGTMVLGAVLFGQVGQQLGGLVGQRVGEMVGGLMGPPLGWVTITSFFSDAKGRRSWEIRTLRQWLGLLVSTGLANAGVLWLLLRDG